MLTIPIGGPTPDILALPFNERLKIVFEQLLAEATLRGDERWKALAQAALANGPHTQPWRAACEALMESLKEP